MRFGSVVAHIRFAVEHMVRWDWLCVPVDIVSSIFVGVVIQVFLRPRGQLVVRLWVISKLTSATALIAIASWLPWLLLNQGYADRTSRASASCFLCTITWYGKISVQILLHLNNWLTVNNSLLCKAGCRNLFSISLWCVLFSDREASNSASASWGVGV